MRYGYYNMTKAAALMLTGCTAVLSCSEELVVPEDRIPVVEEVGAGENGPAPEGTFIVDYSIDGGPSTRAAGGGKLRISSLDYYVYEKATGELLKKRRVSVDPETQVWPMNRENMTWEQRQALQDTLWRNTEYRILFIANVDSTLFNYGGYSESDPHPAVIRNDDNYGTARILLPAVPFNDDNMYCLWEGTLIASGDVEVVNRDDIRLQRIVTRTDIRRTDEPTVLYDAIERGMYADMQTGDEHPVMTAVRERVNLFGDRLQECADYKLLHGPDDYYLDDFKEETGQLINIVKTQESINVIYQKLKSEILTELVGNITSSDIYNKRMLEWSSAESSVVNFSQNEGYKRTNAVGFDRTPYYVSDWYSGSDPNVAICAKMNEADFSFIGFAGSGQMNTITSMSFHDLDGADLFVIDGAEFCTQLIEENTLCIVEGDPADKVKLKVNINTDFNIDLNLRDILNLNENLSALTNNQNFIQALQSFFEGTCYNPYGGHCGDEFRNKSLDSFPFEVSIPDLTSDVDNRITLIPAWTIQQNTSN